MVPIVQQDLFKANPGHHNLFLDEFALGALYEHSCSMQASCSGHFTCLASDEIQTI